MSLAIRERARLLVLLATALTARPALAAPAPAFGVVQAQQPQRAMVHDARDLTPAIRQFPDTYTGLPIEDSSANAKTGKSTRSTPGASVSTTTAPAPLKRTAFDNLDVYYGFFLNGPSLGESWGTTYNRFALNTWPMYIYHTLDVQYHFDRDNLIGAEAAAHHDIQSGVKPYGYVTPVAPEFSIQDPQFWYTRKNVLSRNAFSTNLTLSVWPGLTSYSIDTMKEYFSLGLDTTWFLKLPDRRWSVYFSTRLKPTLYADFQPNDGYSREWLYANAGYYLGYRFASDWQVNLSGTFDCAFYATNDALWNRGDGFDDFAQVELNYFAGRFARLGAYYQTMVWGPAFASSIVGLDFTFYLLSAK
jgi:hypothetical protein